MVNRGYTPASFFSQTGERVGKIRPWEVPAHAPTCKTPTSHTDHTHPFFCRARLGLTAPGRRKVHKDPIPLSD